jgi:hypothetical protein
MYSGSDQHDPFRSVRCHCALPQLTLPWDSMELRYGSVSEYPYGFFIGGSSVPEMNGVYVKQGPDEDALKHHQWEVAFKHDLSG